MPVELHVSPPIPPLPRPLRINRATTVFSNHNSIDPPFASAMQPHSHSHSNSKRKPAFNSPHASPSLPKQQPSTKPTKRNPHLPPLPHLSCPSLPFTPIPSSPPPPTRRNTLPAPSLPLLDLSTLPCMRSTPQDLPTARKSVDAISATLSAIRPYLFLGSQTALLRSASKHDITHVALFTASTAPQPQLERRRPRVLPGQTHVHASGQIRVCAFPLRDDVSEDIDHVFLPVAQLVDAARKVNGRIALVCTQGISRSAACALAYLMLREGMRAEDALADVRATRPIVAPNASFMAALARLEARICAGRAADAAAVVARVARVKWDADAFRDAASPFARCELEAPFVARAAGVAGATWPRVCRGDDVVVVEHAMRRGVTVWNGQFSTQEMRLAGVRIAEDIGAQQIMDAKRFKLPAAVSPGAVNVFMQGVSRRVDQTIENALRR